MLSRLRTFKSMRTKNIFTILVQATKGHQFVIHIETLHNNSLHCEWLFM
jgi:hypothetical protein